MTSVLFVVSAADHWTLSDGSQHPTGFWGEELVEPHRLFTEVGYDITIATPGAKTPTLDKFSMSQFAGTSAEKRRDYEAYLDSIAEALEHPVALADVDESQYDLVFYPGGHGPMQDLAYDRTSGELLVNRLNAGRRTALLCHAPAAVLAATNDDGSNPFAGYEMTGLSNIEERLNPWGWKAPWMLQSRLGGAGITYRKAALPLRPYVVVDRTVYTGQNPQSAVALAERIIQDLGRA